MSTYSDKRINPIDSSFSWRTMDPEYHTVAVLDNLPGVYGFILQDNPRLSTLTITEDITGGEEWTIVSGTPAATGQVFVSNGATAVFPGLCIFNVADNGKSFRIDYEGGGSTQTVEAVSDIAEQAATTAVDDLFSTGSLQADFYKGVDLLVKETGGSSLFKVDSVTGQISNVYNSTVGTDYATTLHEGWLCRAWVNFNGTGTVAIRASANVSSITDNGTGDYTVNFTTNLPDKDFITLVSGRLSESGVFDNSYAQATRRGQTASSTSVGSATTTSTGVDYEYMFVGVFR